MRKQRNRSILALTVFLLAYCGAYFYIRSTRAEKWDQDGKTYVLFPNSKIVWLAYRPLTMIDASLTDMNFHIGPHK